MPRGGGENHKFIDLIKQNSLDPGDLNVSHSNFHILLVLKVTSILAGYAIIQGNIHQKGHSCLITGI